MFAGFIDQCFIAAGISTERIPFFADDLDAYIWLARIISPLFASR